MAEPPVAPGCAACRGSSRSRRRDRSAESLLHREVHDVGTTTRRCPAAIGSPGVEIEIRRVVVAEPRRAPGAAGPQRGSPAAAGSSVASPVACAVDRPRRHAAPPTPRAPVVASRDAADGELQSLAVGSLATHDAPGRDEARALPAPRSSCAGRAPPCALVAHRRPSPWPHTAPRGWRRRSWCSAPAHVPVGRAARRGRSARAWRKGRWSLTRPRSTRSGAAASGTPERGASSTLPLAWGCARPRPPCRAATPQGPRPAGSGRAKRCARPRAGLSSSSVSAELDCRPVGAQVSRSGSRSSRASDAAPRIVVPVRPRRARRPSAPNHRASLSTRRSGGVREARGAEWRTVRRRAVAKSRKALASLVELPVDPAERGPSWQ